MAIFQGKVYYLYSETLSGAYRILSEHPLRDDATPARLYLRAEAVGNGRLVDVTWKTLSVFRQPPGEE